MILYVGRLPVKKLTDKNKPATPPPPSSHSGLAILNAGLNLMIQHDSLFLITNEGVFSKRIGVGGIGANWRIICGIHIFTVHLLPFCFCVTSWFVWGRRKTKVRLLLALCNGTSLVSISTESLQVQNGILKSQAKFHRFHKCSSLYELCFNIYLNHKCPL